MPIADIDSADSPISDASESSLQSCITISPVPLLLAEISLIQREDHYIYLLDDSLQTWVRVRCGSGVGRVGLDVEASVEDCSCENSSLIRMLERIEGDRLQRLQFTNGSSPIGLSGGSVLVHVDLGMGYPPTHEAAFLKGRT